MYHVLTWDLVLRDALSADFRSFPLPQPADRKKKKKKKKKKAATDASGSASGSKSGRSSRSGSIAGESVDANGKKYVRPLYVVMPLLE